MKSSSSCVKLVVCTEEEYNNETAAVRAAAQQKSTTIHDADIGHVIQYSGEQLYELALTISSVSTAVSLKLGGG